MRVEVRAAAVTRDGSNLPQSRFWGTFKSRFGWKARGFTFSLSSRLKELLVLTRDLGPEAGFAYVPSGPDVILPDSWQGQFLEALSRQLKSRLPPSCVFIRYDLPWETPYAREREYRLGRRGIRRPSPRIREMRMNFGTERWNLRKAPTDLQAPDTVLLDISGDPDSILASMRQNTRYAIRLAGREGVTVEEASADELPRWYELYRRSTDSHGIGHSAYEYFHELFRLAAGENPGGVALRLLLACRKKEIIAGAILALHGRKATYLYAASSPEQRKYMPGYAVQWKAIQVARAGGCTVYDLFGIAPADDPSHPLHGLYRFKTGFGGTVLHRLGCWDYPLRLDLYRRYRGLELAEPGPGE